MQLLCFTHICISPYVLLVSQGPKDSQPCKLYCTSTHPPELSTTMKQNLENERKKQYSKPSLRKGLPVPWIPALTAVSWLSEHPIKWHVMYMCIYRIRFGFRCNPWGASNLLYYSFEALACSYRANFQTFKTCRSKNTFSFSIPDWLTSWNEHMFFMNFVFPGPHGSSALSSCHRKQGNKIFQILLNSFWIRIFSNLTNPAISTYLLAPLLEASARLFHPEQ